MDIWLWANVNKRNRCFGSIRIHAITMCRSQAYCFQQHKLRVRSVKRNEWHQTLFSYRIVVRSFRSFDASKQWIRLWLNQEFSAERKKTVNKLSLCMLNRWGSLSPPPFVSKFNPKAREHKISFRIHFDPNNKIMVLAPSLVRDESTVYNIGIGTDNDNFSFSFAFVLLNADRWHSPRHILNNWHERELLRWENDCDF